MGEDLWDYIPSAVYVALGRRGREKLEVKGCYLEGCDNPTNDEIEPLDKNVVISDKNEDGSYSECTRIRVKCKKCGGIFQFAVKTVYLPYKNPDGTVTVEPFMGMLFILDENGGNLGFLGYL